MGKGCTFSNATLWLCSIAGSVAAATDSESVSLAAVVAVLGGETSGFLGGPYTSHRGVPIPSRTLRRHLDWWQALWTRLTRLAEQLGCQWSLSFW